jgi:cell division protein FtsN
MVSLNRQRGGTLLGVFIGLVFGVLLSLVVVWYFNKMPIPFQDKTNHTERAAAGEAAQTGQPLALPGKPGDKVGDRGTDKVGDKSGDKPRFEFYKILPGSQEAAPAPVAKSSEGKAAAEPMFLQAGSFQKAADADNLKAKLALLGMEANVQEAEIAEKGKMFRVRVGPFSSVDEMNRARSQLSQNGVQTNTVKGNQ